MDNHLLAAVGDPSLIDAEDGEEILPLPEEAPNPFDKLAFRGLTVRDDGSLFDEVGSAVDNDRLRRATDSDLRSARKTRAPFTPDDDELLAQWMETARRQGVSDTGLKVFQDLEAAYPHHPHLSWRGRWYRLGQHRAYGTPPVGSYTPPTVTPRNLAVPVPPPQSGFLSSTPLAVQTSSGPSTVTGPNVADHKGPGDAPPPHFRAVAYDVPKGRDTPSKLQYSSEITLRKLLNVDSRDELAGWLKQDWVMDVYIEYAECVLDVDWPTHDASGTSIRRSMSKYTINNAIEALRSKKSRYLLADVDKAGWTLDDHDIRYIVQLIVAGRQPGRAWERRQSDADLPHLCAVGYRLAAWLRAKCDSSGKGGTHVERETIFRWLKFLSDHRARRLQQRQNPSSGPGSSNSFSSFADVAAPLHVPNPQPGLGLGTDDADSPGYLTADEGESGTELDDGETLQGDVGGSSPDQSRRPVDGGKGVVNEPADADVDSTGSSLGEDSRPLSGPVDVVDDDDDVTDKGLLPRLPPVPTYSVATKTAGGIGELEAIWLMEEGQAKFRELQRTLLAKWGVSSSQTEACVLVPNMWLHADPTHLLGVFKVEDAPSNTVDRLKFALNGKSTSFARATAWFARPRRGIDLDNFLGQSLFAANQGSHLCHQGHCITPGHITWEPADDNYAREQCQVTAKTLRSYQVPFPATCNRHNPPCLLAHAALTTEEAYCVQFANLSRAIGGSLANPPRRPSDHPFSTFEVGLPLSFCATSREISPDHLTRPDQGPQPGRARSPVFYCLFCKVRTYKSVASYWTHIRDEHSVVPQAARLQEIRRTADVWSAYLDDQVEQRGIGTRRNDPTFVKLQQIQQENFDWDVVTSWKLRGFRER